VTGLPVPLSAAIAVLRAGRSTGGAGRGGAGRGGGLDPVEPELDIPPLLFVRLDIYCTSMIASQLKLKAS